MVVCSHAWSQRRPTAYASDTAKSISILHVSYGAFFPGGDMAERFGWHSELGAGYWRKTKSNLIFAISGSVMIGENIKDDTNMFDGLKNSEGGIIGNDGLYAEYSFFQRGYRFPVLKIGKLFPVKISKANNNSGFYGLVGVGFMQHKIRVTDHSKNFTQVQSSYIKGYDRLTNGLMFTENLGYLYLGKNRHANLKVSFELSQAFTKSRRSFNFDTGLEPTKARLDLLYGFKLAWSIPLYKKMAEGYFVQ